MFGIVGGFGLKKIWQDHYYIALDGRFEYDITDSEPPNFKENSHLGGNQTKKVRGHTHNIRLGFNIGIGYIFSVEKVKKKRTK